jgi:hypothetical protein
MNNDLLLYALTLLLPTLLAAGLALPFWWRKRIIAGNVAGSALIILVITVLIWYQWGVSLTAQTQCVGNCFTDVQSIYLPFLLLVVLGWVDVFLLLVISGLVEDRLKRKRRMKNEWV